MATLKDHEGRLQRIEKLLTHIAQEAAEEQNRLIVAPTGKQTAIVGAMK